MTAIRELSIKHKTNEDLGKAIREFINDNRYFDPNQLNLNLNDSEDSDT